MRKIFFLTFLLSGCAAIQPPVIIKPMPAPPKCINIPGESCKRISAGNVGGTTLGNHDESILEENNR